MIKIFDLDGTVIDSTHRQTYREDGTLSISNWRENNTPDLIAQDKLLPLAKQMRTAINERWLITCGSVNLYNYTAWFRMPCGSAAEHKEYLFRHCLGYRARHWCRITSP